MTPTSPRSPLPLPTLARQWAWIGCTGFGGPPVHIALLRRLCVTDRGWLTDREFEDGIAATALLPGPASTQLAIFCAWRVRGTAGALVGGLCFILPGLALILLLAAVFLGSPPLALRGAAAGTGGAVAAVAVHAAAGLLRPSRRSATNRLRWAAYLLTGALAGAVAGPYVVVVLLGCGLLEVAAARPSRLPPLAVVPVAPAALVTAMSSGLGGLAWVALKVGLLSYGGGFVIVPLMQADAVDRYHWLTAGEFLNAVALGQVTPGPVVQTVAVVGYAAAGVGGALLAAVVAFAPSFVLVLLGAPRFDRLRADPRVAAFLRGAGPASLGAVAGSAVPLAGALAEPWQLVVLAAAAVWLLLLRRGVVSALLLAGAAGAVAVLGGLPAAT